MTKPRSTRIRKGVEVIDAGRRATVVRTTTLNVHGPMADLIYQDDESTGCAMIADLVRADEVAELLPATVYTTMRVTSSGEPLPGISERRYRATDEARAAELAASNILISAEYNTASVSYNEDGVWTFTPSTGSPVHVRVTEYTPDDAAATARDAAEQAEADEHEQQQLDAVGKHEETLTEDSDKSEAIAALFGGTPPPLCPRCAGSNGNHGLVHVRHGNGGGHNEPCPNAPSEITPPKYPEGTPEHAAYVAELIPELEKFARREPPYDGSTRSTCCGEPMSPENRCENCGERGAPELQTWDDVDVVARTEQLHPATHPYRANEVVEYVGPSGIGSWVHGPMHFRRMVESDMAEIMTMSGPKYVEVADLRRPSGNVAVELTPEDIRQIFQALATETDRLGAIKPQLWPDTLALTVELRDRFAALHR